MKGWGGLWRGLLSAFCVMGALWLIAPAEQRPYLFVAVILFRIAMDLNEASNREYRAQKARDKAEADEAARRARDLARFRKPACTDPGCGDKCDCIICDMEQLAPGYRQMRRRKP